ncbi:MAG: glycosyltransferase family 2 protein [Brachybacterium tyrofermentans]|nr:putative glycosyltransferase [Corynebacterium xerosis]
MSALTTTAYAVIIVNYGDPALIAANIGADVDADEHALIVVVDNYSTDHARTQARSLAHERGWAFVASPNDGFGAGVNRGVAAARAQGHTALITLNPDAVASADVLRELGRHVAADPLALVSPFMDSGDGRPHFRGARVNRRTGQMRSGWSEGDQDPEWANWLSGACLAFSAEAFDALGGFSEDFFLYWEDVDISCRAAEQGMRLEIRPDLLVVHDEGGTQDAGSARTKSPTYYRYNIRNRMLFGRRHARGRDWARWVLASPRQSALIWMRGGRKQAFTEPRGLLAAARGFLEGLAQLARAPRSRETVPATRPRPPAPTRELTGPVRITIAIPSYKRPEQLAALLAALPDRIAETVDATVDVLVVDNDPAGSARASVENAPLDVRYAHETTPGISAVRNRALDECPDSDLLAFLDDDEIPLVGWLSSLVEVWREHGSSAVAGRVISVFHGDTDPWVIASGTFRRKERVTGESMHTAAAGNLLLDMQQVRHFGTRFDDSLGLSGGEDTLFTRQLVASGGTIVSCNESAAEDYVVASRLTRDWAKQRAFSSGNGWVHVGLLLAPSTPRRLAMRGRYLLAGSARVAAGLARHRYGTTRGHLEHDARGTRTFHRGRGMLAGARGSLYQEYARE